MKIGFVTGQFGNIFRGGAEIQFEGTLRALKSKGLNVVEINNKTRSIDKLDILHFFKTDESYLPLVDYAMALNKKIVETGQGLPFSISHVVWSPAYVLNSIVLILQKSTTYFKFGRNSAKFNTCSQMCVLGYAF